MQNFLRDALLRHALLADAAAQNWERRPDVAAALRAAHDTIVAQSFLSSKATIPSGYPSDAELQAAYDHNKASFMQPRQYRLLQLFTPKPPPGKPAGERILMDLRARITSGSASFSKQAAAAGPVQFADMGWVSEAQLAQAAKTAISGLPEGSITDPICIEGVCHLIKLVATRPAGPQPLSELRPALTQALRQARQREAEQAYAASLLAKTPVLVNEKLLLRLKP